MKRISVSEIRKFNATALRALDEPLEICHQNVPLRVLVPYKLYMQIQELYLVATRASLRSQKGKNERT